MAKKVEKIRDILEYYDKLVSSLLSMGADIRKLEIKNNAKAAKRILFTLREMRKLKKGPVTEFYFYIKKVQDEIRKAVLTKY